MEVARRFGFRAFNRDYGDFFPDYVPDPLHPDCIGELVEVVYINMDLWSQNAVNFACRRLYEMVTYGIKIARFEAPLIFITDPGNPLQTKPRPLRYYDPVLEKSNKMIAIYELEASSV